MCLSEMDDRNCLQMDLLLAFVLDFFFIFYETIACVLTVDKFL